MKALDLLKARSMTMISLSTNAILFESLRKRATVKRRTTITAMRQNTSIEILELKKIESFMLIYGNNF